MIISGFPRTRENGKRPWIWNFVPGREKARNSGLESWKLTYDRENWFYEFCLTNELLVTETQSLVCCFYSRNSQICRVSTGNSGHNGSPFPISQSEGQNWQTGTRHYFAHAHRAETRQPQNSTNMETLKPDTFCKRHLPTLLSDNNQHQNWLSHGRNLWYVKLQYKTDRWRWKKVPCYRPRNSRKTTTIGTTLHSYPG